MVSLIPSTNRSGHHSVVFQMSSHIGIFLSKNAAFVKTVSVCKKNSEFQGKIDKKFLISGTVITNVNWSFPSICIHFIRLKMGIENAMIWIQHEQKISAKKTDA